MHFLLNALEIVMIDLLLAGDNALVIALAVRTLPKPDRRLGLACGAGGAVLLRVALTTVAARLLTVPYLQIAGGLFILWIALKVLIDASAAPDEAPSASRFWQAIWYIVLADVTMSTVRGPVEQPACEPDGSVPRPDLPGRGHPRQGRRRDDSHRRAGGTPLESQRHAALRRGSRACPGHYGWWAAARGKDKAASINGVT